MRFATFHLNATTAVLRSGKIKFKVTCTTKNRQCTIFSRVQYLKKKLHINVDVLIYNEILFISSFLQN